MKEKDIEKELQQFVDKEENVQTVPPEDAIKEMMRSGAKKANENIRQGGVLTAEEAAKATGYTGFTPLVVKDMPTKGKFYPIGLKVFIRAATAGEIREWSMLNEDDINSIDDALIKIIKKCCKFSLRDNDDTTIPLDSFSYRDLKDIDRFYIILAIRELTFPGDTNELQMNLSEGKTLSINKSNLDFVNIDESLTKFYSPEERCFVFTSAKHLPEPVKIYLPSIGVASWIKNYIITKSQAQEGFDLSFATIAPYLIPDHRGLNERTYERLVREHSEKGVFVYSLIADVIDKISGSINPTIKYIDEAGGEQTAPLTFRGGFKSLFLLQDTLSLLD